MSQAIVVLFEIVDIDQQQSHMTAGIFHDIALQLPALSHPGLWVTHRTAHPFKAFVCCLHGKTTLALMHEPKTQAQYENNQASCQHKSLMMSRLFNKTAGDDITIIILLHFNMCQAAHRLDHAFTQVSSLNCGITLQMKQELIESSQVWLGTLILLPIQANIKQAIRQFYLKAGALPVFGMLAILQQQIEAIIQIVTRTRGQLLAGQIA